MAADPRQFTEHNTLGNVSVYLEDKRMEELKSATAKTSSQISTSAQYIPLQDTDGNLVKINPASFEEAVRNVLGSLLANNDKGTTISGLPALSGSGANLDFGSVTPANLASVLGVWVTGKPTQSIDLPFSKGNLGVYFDTGNSLPYGCAYVVHLGNAQFAIGTPGSELLYFRVKNSAQTSWMNWRQITLI